MKKGTLIIILFLLNSTFIQANEARIITLEQAIQIALDQNIEIQLGKNEIERQESQLRRSRADFLPNLNATTSGSRTIGRQFDMATITFDDITSNNLNANISANMVVFNGLQNINQLRSSRLGVESAEERYQRVREGIIFQTASAYLNYLLAAELLEIEKENLSAGLRQLEQVEAQVEVGMRPIVDLFSQESIAANNELAVIQRENQLNLSKLRLLRILQFDPMEEVEFVAPTIQEEELVIRDFDLVELIEHALQSRSDFRASELELQQARYALSISKGMRLPEVSLSASLSSAYRGQQRDPLTGSVMAFDDQFFDANINRSVSFNVRIPIFNRLQTTTQIQQRRIDFKNAELRLEDLQQEMYLELQQAYNDYIGYAKELEATEKALIAAEKAYETEQERYNVGSATLIELTNANNAYVRASSNRVQAVFQFVFQEKVLDYFLGRITEDFQISALSEN
ncbi:TolC family protein [Balneolaceae bacterium ANBcel3]|nr:TolC family protein [Balneolaceae bacterium ANBcel3]